MWPTFPQIYINGEFYGGCDIMLRKWMLQLRGFTKHVPVLCTQSLEDTVTIF